MVGVLSVEPDAAMSAAIDAMLGPFSRARSDCWRTAAAAFEALFGVDPMGPHAYATLAQAKRLVRDGGGRDAYCAHLAARAGLIEAAPAPGLIGMVKTPGHELEWAGGICIEPGTWAVKCGPGVRFLAEHVRCWGVPRGA